MKPWKKRELSSRFEFAKRNLTIPAGVEMLPLRTAEFRKTECDNRMIFEIVDFHSPRLVKIAASIFWNPLFLGDTTEEIFVSGEDEEEIGQPVQKSHSILADLFALRKVHHRAFGATADCARKVDLGGSRAPSRKNEIVQRRQFGHHAVDLGFQPCDLDGLDASRALPFP